MSSHELNEERSSQLSQPDSLHASAQSAQNATTAQNAQKRFNSDEFYRGLDSIFTQAEGATKALPYLEDSLAQAVSQHDDFAELTVISEFLGFDRSHGRHDHSRQLCERALELSEKLHLENSAESTILLINIATAYRQAGDYDDAQRIYEKAISESEHTLPDTDRRKAALHNNFSMLLSETGHFEEAREELTRALRLMQLSSPHPESDGDIATTFTNLGLLELQLGDTEKAVEHAKLAFAMYQNYPQLQNSAHYTSALAGYAQVLFIAGDLEKSLHYFEQALDLIGQFYGTSSGYYETTQENVQLVRDAISAANTNEYNKAHSPASLHADEPLEPLFSSGLDLSRAYWQTYADQLFSGDFGQIRSRAAVGLVGHGSECYGFDDELSHDHDFGPRFCVWLTTEDFERYGRELQARYDALTSHFGNFDRSPRSPRNTHRDGVMTIDSFFESITGLSHAPKSHDEDHIWLNLSEATLAAATNGEIFADPYGAFSSRRQAFKNMPEDVRLFLISQHLGMIAQTGQYNFARMMQRGDTSAAVLTLSEFAQSVSSLIFLMNNPVSVGYAPYYKWRFAALRKLSNRMGTRLADVCPLLEELLQESLTSTQTDASVNSAQNLIDTICAKIVDELNVQGLSSSREDFLEWHRPYVEAHIESRNPLLHSI